MSVEEQAGQGEFGRESANDRFKQQFGSLSWIGLSLAVMLHFAIFAFFPDMTAADVSFSTPEFEAVDIPPEVEIPPPPEPIARPATPVISDAVIDEDITITPTTFEDNPIDDLPPPVAVATDISSAPTFTPMTIRPELQNRDQVQREIRNRYPAMLRDAGIGGQAVFWFFIDERGRVVRTQLQRSTGYPALDQAAEAVAQMMQFSPAYNRDQVVPVWIELPITFSSR